VGGVCGRTVWTMDVELPGPADPRRVAVSEWLASNPRPSNRAMAESGYVAPHWPRPWGLDADPIHQLIIDDEFSKSRVKRPVNMIGIGWAGPTILFAGTAEQKERYLFPMLAGEEVWCQLFSEPDHGSDLANMSTRAVRDGETYVVNGSKIWSSGAHNSQFGILIARTDPDAAKHRGISYFICPMDSPGIELTPIIDMTSNYSFNQTFFTDVVLPAENRVGDENDGWRLAKVTLGNERVSLSGQGVIWGSGPSAEDLVDLVCDRGGIDDAVLKDRLVQVHIEGRVLDWLRMRTLAALLAGDSPGAEASVRKVLSDAHGQHVMVLAKDLAGPHGMLSDSGPMGAGPYFDDGDDGVIGQGSWPGAFLFSPALTIGGGTSEVQLNIIAERVLGLPRDINVETGKTWAQARRAVRAVRFAH